MNMNWIARSLVVASVMSLGACSAFRVSCNDVGTYGLAEELPPLKVPTGLDAPDTRVALKIPEVVEPERPRAATDECLESPPKYTAPKAEPKA
jgi:uncharacterized lipoprotein